MPLADDLQEYPCVMVGSGSAELERQVPSLGVHHLVEKDPRPV